MRKILKFKWIGRVIFGVITAYGMLYLAGICFEVKSLSSPKNGPQTPGTLGAPFEQVVFSSHGRQLHGYVVHSGKSRNSERAVLIFHGAGENIADWALPQKLLWEGGVSSMVFDYSGNGDSSAWRRDGVSMKMPGQHTISLFRNFRRLTAGLSWGSLWAMRRYLMHCRI